MNLVPVPHADINQCLDIFRYLGFSHLCRPDNSAFEQHILSNRKLLSIHGEVIAVISHIHFYDDPAGDRVLEPGMIEGKRRFVWKHKFIQLPTSQSLDHQNMYAVAMYGDPRGFPLGIITDEPQRRHEVEHLGTVVEGAFSKIVQFKNAEVRLYAPCRELPSYTPETFRRRN